MSAPDLATLYRVEDAVETAWKTVLEADGLTVFKSISEDVLTVPRVDVECALGAPTGHRFEVTPGQWTMDAWQATIRCNIKTKRFDAQPALHQEWISKVRLAGQYFTDRFSEATLPFHTLTMIQESGTDRGVDDTDDTDFSTIQWDAIVCIRSNAWPS
jgi:hypothetical protein